MVKTVSDVEKEFQESCKEFVETLVKEIPDDKVWDKISTRLEKSTKDLLEYCLLDNNPWKTIFFYHALGSCPMNAELWDELDVIVKTR